MDIFAVREYIQSKVMAAALETDPSPHFVVNEFFPPEIYEAIHTYNLFHYGEGEEWIKQKDIGRRNAETPFHLRKQIDIRGELEAPPVAVTFWKDLERVFFEDNWFGELIYNKYPQYFDIRFGPEARDPKFFDKLKSMLFVQRHDRGYSIGPHTDAPKRVFTCIFYFPQMTGGEKFGTQFLRPLDGNSRCSGHGHHDARDFEVVKTVDYAPNNFLLFFKTSSAFHGVAHIDEDVPNDRYGMQLGFYEPDGGVYKDLSGISVLDGKGLKPLLSLKLFGRKFRLMQD
ncbi:hypothetical protein KFK14_13070 [Sphingobium phenoxybenzoativorans]|uniref:Fe2OG dioxygenase domain-containing protein n=1 Tax=Sphingobium phenoxybenzoativorans TaxID=1592790 RepID=A0A975Q066_9SPHN|nr:hypothetical protein [Sphingobium phenoxybenzoativorans]QUT04078.1 hypothetical protein KFK14_13070 [Sphingobium phenoxybenzoativorans]